LIDNMKDIYIIAAYTPTKHKEDTLRELIRSIKKFGKDVLLISHSNTSPDIISDVNFHFYDYENKLLDDNDLKFWVYHDNPSFRITSKYFTKSSTHILPCYRLFLYGLSIAKMLGYDNAHYVEYDSKFKNTSEFDSNNEILKTHDAVIYMGDMLSGALLSINLNSYRYDDIRYDEKEIISDYRMSGDLTVERLTYNRYFNNKKVFIKNVDEISNSLLPAIITADSSILITPIFEDNISIFITTSGIEQSDAKILVNGYIDTNITINNNCWYMRPIGSEDIVKLIQVYINGNLTRTFDFTTKEKIDEAKKWIIFERH